MHDKNTENQGNKQPKKGRPKLSTSQKRLYQVHLRFTAEEYNLLKLNSTKTQLAPFIRETALHGANIAYRRSDEFIKLEKQIKKIGNNLNQITYYINSNRSTPTEFEYFEKQVNEMKIEISKLHRKLKSL